MKVKTGNERFHAQFQFSLHRFDLKTFSVWRIIKFILKHKKRFNEKLEFLPSISLSHCTNGSFDCPRISVIADLRSASDNLAVDALVLLVSVVWD